MNTPETNPLKTSPMTASFKPASFRSFRSLALIAFTAVLAAGCHKKQPVAPLPPDTTPPPPVAAPTASITADPAAIDVGQSVVLNWRTANANIVTIDGIGQVNFNGTQTVSPANSTNFHLVAKGDGGLVEANVRVTVRQAPPVAPTPAPGGTNFPTAVTDQVFRENVKDVFFDYDSFDLRPDGQQSVVAAAAFLVAHPNIRVLIGGYADERGSAEYNLALGENRANSAKTGLVNAGVAAARLRVISYGKEKQFCTEANETCWQENRRAQFTIDK